MSQIIGLKMQFGKQLNNSLVFLEPASEVKLGRNETPVCCSEEWLAIRHQNELFNKISARLQIYL
jgi:hypothetical protein